MPIDRATADKTLATPHGELAYKIVVALHDAGHDTWWVGGCTRDMLNGNVPKDIDIATDAKPEDSLSILQKIWPKLTVDEAGKVLGNIIVTINGETFEVTTFREDDEASDGRHPESVVFGTREKDAARRDLTINAMYWNPISREMFDPFEGAGDLHERLIRFIGDPAIRMKHDALRMLRAVRFRALMDGQYHPETYRALSEQAKLVEVLSGTRIAQEMEKILKGPKPQVAFEDLWELGILKYMLPELEICKGIPQPADYHHEGDVWNHTMQLLSAFKEEHSIDARIAGLFHDCGKAETFSLKERIRFDHHASVSADLATKALTRFQYPAKRREKITWLIEHHMMMGSFADMTEERKAHWYFHPWFPELLQIFWLDIAGTDPADFHLYEEIEKDYHHFLDTHPRPPKPLLAGEEVMEILQIKQGDQVGKAMKALHEAQIRKEVSSKAEAKKFLENLRGTLGS